jgi:purine-nucleoside phosphorylase
MKGYLITISKKFSFSSIRLTEKIDKELQNKKVLYKRGSSWTIDSMYRETLDEIRHYEQEGIDTVEMEAASMFAGANFRKVHMAGMFVISDFVTFEAWKEYLTSEDTTNAIFQSVYVAKKVLEKL